MKLPTIDELREYAEYAGLPFFIKGAMSVHDAKAAANIGCAGNGANRRALAEAHARCSGAMFARASAAGFQLRPALWGHGERATLSFIAFPWIL